MTTGTQLDLGLPPAAARRRRHRRGRDEELRPRPVRLPDHEIRTEHQLVQILDAGVYHLDDVADAAERAGVADRTNGRSRRYRNGRPGEEVFRHRVRAAFDARRRQRGDARSLGDAYWVIDGTRSRPANAVFIFLGRISDITLALGAAADVARRIEEPAALIFTDPSWQIGVGQGRDAREDTDYYGRDRSLLVPGYVEVPPDEDYYEWSCEWIEPAARLLRPGGHLAVVTGPRQSAAVQMAAEHAGLQFTNSIVIPKVNGVAPARYRYATSHFRLTLMTASPARAGDSRHPDRRPTFNTLPEMGTDERGQPFPRDVWPPVLPYLANGRMRYANQLPPVFADQVVRTLSNRDDLVVDFFAGSGTVPRICLFRERRCFASDLNPWSLKFTMATINDITRTRLAAPTLFDSGTDLFPELRADDDDPANPWT